MFEITDGIIAKAQKVIIYGPEGIGKTTFASKLPNPLFIDTEGSTSNMDVKRLPNPTSWQMLLEEVEYVKRNPNVCETLVIDTADWAEQLAMANICAVKNIKGIEDIGYGKGYVYLYEEFGRLLNKLNELINVGINVVFTAHAQMRKFEQPDEMGAYDRWELKLQKKTAPLIKEWADMVLFANYKTVVINVDGQGASKGKNKAQGGQRVMYASHHPCWDAKNRHNLPEELNFDYSAIAHVFNRNTADAAVERVTNFFGKENVEIIEYEEPKEIKLETPITPEDDYPIMNEYKDIPKALVDLMKPNNVTVEELMNVIALKGHFPKGTPFRNFPEDYVNGVLIGAWEQVLKMINEERNLPF